jgi:hypothetical protein
MSDEKRPEVGKVYRTAEDIDGVPKGTLVEVTGQDGERYKVQMTWKGREFWVKAAQLVLGLAAIGFLIWRF